MNSLINFMLNFIVKIGLIDTILPFIIIYYLLYLSLQKLNINDKHKKIISIILSLTIVSVKGFTSRLNQAYSALFSIVLILFMLVLILETLGGHFNTNKKIIRILLLILIFLFGDYLIYLFTNFEIITTITYIILKVKIITIIFIIGLGYIFIKLMIKR